MEYDKWLTLSIVFAIVSVTCCVVGIAFSEPSEEQGERIMTDVDVTGGITKATVEYLGKTSTAGNQYRVYVNVLAGETGTVTIPKSVLSNRLSEASGPINGPIKDYLAEAWNYALSGDNLVLTLKTAYTTLGNVATYNAVYQSGIEESYVTIYDNKIPTYRTVDMVYISVTVVNPSVSLNTGSEWVTGTPYVNTGSEYVKAKKVFVHDGTGWKLSK